MAVNNLTSHHRPPIIGAWVDQGFGCDGEYMPTKEKFKKLSTFIERWHFFKTPEKFYEFLDDNPKTQIFLVMSGYNAQTIVPQRHEYENIHSMYVFCSVVGNHRRLKEEYAKVKDVMNLEDDLYKQIADTLSELLFDIGESYTRSQDRGLAKNYLEEALRLMRDILRFKHDHGRIQKTNDLLEGLEHGTIYNLT
jgi:superfamily II RNA helicase